MGLGFIRVLGFLQYLACIRIFMSILTYNPFIYFIFVSYSWLNRNIKRVFLGLSMALIVIIKHIFYYFNTSNCVLFLSLLKPLIDLNLRTLLSRRFTTKDLIVLHINVND